MAGASTDKETPLMKQYHSIKAQYPGAILLFRVGDFYETFSEDARIASKAGAYTHLTLPTNLRVELPVGGVDFKNKKQE